MVKRLRLIVLLLISTFIITGCEIQFAFVKNPLSEKDIINYVKKSIFTEYGDDVTVKIVSRDDLKVCTYIWDVCDNPDQLVRGGKSYTLEIVNNKYNVIVAEGQYDDGYVAYGTRYDLTRIAQKGKFTSNYGEKRGLLKIKDDFEVVLKEKYDKFYVFMDIGNTDNYDIFISTSSDSDVSYLIEEFNKIALEHEATVHMTYSIYIYKNPDVFNSIDFDSYTGNKDSSGKDMIELFTLKTASQIGYSNSFDNNLFITNGASAAAYDEQYVDFNTFDYIVFWYYSGNNPYQRGDLPELHVFGIK